jgi:anthraniloyl-CoA monooxygenase
MNIIILGAGPAGLYAGLLIKKNNPSYRITILERNPADVTYGWGVVFSDRTLSSFQRADYKSYEQITNRFVLWDDIDILYRGERISCGGHVIAGIARKMLLAILQERCREQGIELRFRCDITDLSKLPAYDLLIAADGINSVIRRTYPEHFKPEITYGRAKYIWLGADKVLDAFTFVFQENEHGLFQVHAYPYNGTSSTILVECDEATWLAAGLDKAGEAESLNYCQTVLADFLQGARLLSNNSRWISFATLKTQHWHYQNMVLLGDAAHTAHFSIGSGTKLAMEDAIALASALEQHTTLEVALNEFELERKPVVELFQRAAAESQAYFETVKRYLNLEPLPFAFQLLTRSGRITYDDLRFRDVAFGEVVDRWNAKKSAQDLQSVSQRQRTFYELSRPIFAPPPLQTPRVLRSLVLTNRIVQAQPSDYDGETRDGMPGEAYIRQFLALAQYNLGVLLAETVAISPEARITSGCVALSTPEQLSAWCELIQQVHVQSTSRVAIELNHAGRRGSVLPRSAGLDRPLRSGNWPLVAPSALPYSSQQQVPREMDEKDMRRIRDDFVRATHLVLEADCDLLQLNMAHGYLLASFLSSLTNLRTDGYGGTLDRRLRYPLEVFDAVRATWPENKPLSVALTVSDCARGGLTVDDAVFIARTLKEHGCDLIAVQVGQTNPEGEPVYGRGFLTAFSERIHNEARIPTMVGGYLVNSDQINTILAAGRADLCIVASPMA